MRHIFKVVICSGLISCKVAAQILEDQKVEVHQFDSYQSYLGSELYQNTS